MPNGQKEGPTLVEYADQLIMEYHLKTRTDSKDTYYYNSTKGVYINADLFLDEICQKIIHDCDTAMITEIKKIIGRKTHIEPSKFNHSSNIINLENGLLNLEDLKLLADGSLDLENIKLLPHTHEVITTVQLPVSFEKFAKCPKTEKFHQDVLNPEDIKLAYEIAGWFLWSVYHIHKAIMMYGKGRNGKGTLLRLWQAFLGDTNCSHVSLQRLVDDKFAASDLLDKAANIYGDLPKKDLSETDVFKCATGGDTLRVERKFGHAFSLLNRAKMAFSTNNLPKSVDDSEGFFSRWIIIEFNRIFGPEEIDSNLDEKLHTEEELSGYLNLALEGLTRLRANNWKFSYSKTLEDVTRMYKRLSDHVYAFLEDEYEYSPDGTVIKQELFKHYGRYAKEHNLNPMGINKFGRAI
ncbi:MAG: phage/plasmid primase, P4 family, partial [Minisyncoccia bacterium]